MDHRVSKGKDLTSLLKTRSVESMSVRDKDSKRQKQLQSQQAIDVEDDVLVEEGKLLPGQLGPDVYTVEQILDKKYQDGNLFYNVKWVGWAPDFNTWEPSSNLFGCSDMLASFEREEKARQKSKALSENKTTKKTPTVIRPNKGDKSELVLTDSKDDAPGSSKSSLQDQLPKLTDKEQSEKNSAAKNVPESSTFTENDILSYVPPGKVPRRVYGVVPLDRKIVYLVQWITGEDDEPLSASNCDLIASKCFREQYPQVVIDFYASRMKWTNEVTSPEDTQKAADAVIRGTQRAAKKSSKDKDTDVDTTKNKAKANVDKFGLPSDLDSSSSDSNSSSDSSE